MRSVGRRKSAGSGATGYIWHGFRFAARIVGTSFVQHQSLEKTTSSPCMAKISVLKIGQRQKPKSAVIHSVALLQVVSLSTISLVGLATIPCTLLVITTGLMWPDEAKVTAMNDMPAPHSLTSSIP